MRTVLSSSCVPGRSAAGLVFLAPNRKYSIMLRPSASLLGLLLPCAALAQTPGALHATYDTFAAGLHVADVETGFSFGPRTYEMNLRYHTTGMVGLLFSGHQSDQVAGVWHGQHAVPGHFVGL